MLAFKVAKRVSSKLLDFGQKFVFVNGKRIQKWKKKVRKNLKRCSYLTISSLI